MATLDSAYATGNDTLTVTEWWFKPISNLSLSAYLSVSSFKFEEKEVAGVFTGLGRSRPIVVSDTMLGIDGEIEVITKTEAEYTTLKSIIRHQGTIYLSTPDNLNMHIRIVKERQGERVNTGSYSCPLRIHRISFVQVDTPA